MIGRVRDVSSSSASSGCSASPSSPSGEAEAAGEAAGAGEPSPAPVTPTASPTASPAASPGVPAGVQARLLGPPHLVLRTGTHALERKDAALLALLALEGPTARDRAAALLWPEAGAAGARSSLRQRLHRLRRLVGSDLVQGTAELRLADALAHDLPDPPALRRRLEADADALEGELLGTLDYADCRELAAWVGTARERWRGARRDVLLALGAELHRRDRVAAALACAERLVRDEPAFEPAHRMLMRLHLRRGDRAAALAAYERCREALARDAAAAPDAQTRALHLRALHGVEASSAAPRREPVAVLRPPRLIGREGPWAQLVQAWAAGQVVVLAGEPGIGKTRLLADFAAARPGSVVVGGRPGDAHIAYALLARLLRALLVHVSGPLPEWVAAQVALLLPERGGAAAKSWNAVRLRQALVEVLARTAGEVQGVLVDDAQFCDAATLELLCSTCLDAGSAGPDWLIAVRANEVPPSFAAWVAAADRERLCELRLPALDAAGVESLLASLGLPGLDAAAAAPALYRRCGGNPMFLLETLRASLVAEGAAGEGEVGPGGEADRSTTARPAGRPPLSSLSSLSPASPPHIGELIGRRLAQLSGAARDLAQAAALAGQDFDAALAAEVLQCHALDLVDPWRELEAAQVIRDGAFAHDLVFEATLRSVPPARARELHACIAGWLERHAGEPARMAAHWKEAGRWAEAGHAFAAAAERLRSRVRRDEEAELLQEAVACLELAGEHEARAEALHHLFRSHWDRKYRAGMREVAAQLQQVAGSPKARMFAAIARAQMASDEQPDDDSLALVVQAREAAEHYARVSGDETQFVYIHTWEASLLGILNRPDAALRTLRRTVELMERVPEGRWRGHIHYNLGFTLEVCGALGEALDQFDRSEKMMLELDEPVHVADARSMSSVTLFHLGRLAEATRRLDSGRRMWAEMNGGRAEPHTSDVWIARFWREAGRLGPAVALLTDTVERASRIADVNLQGWAAAELASLFVLLGQPARARPLLALARAAPKPHVRFDGLLAEVRLARAVGERAEPALDEARRLVPQCLRADRLGWLLDVECARSLPATEAAALMRANLEAARAGQAWSVAAPSHAMWIEALSRGGDVEGAAAQARALAVLLAEPAPAPAERPPMFLSAAEHWLILHRAFEAAGAAGEARDALRRGVAWIEQLVLPELPAGFHDSFVHRNPIHRALLAAARAGRITPR
jgi:DNA-binding SARP family transcriptional activator